MIGFERPGGPPLPLAVQPRLASWEKTGHPDQIRLKAFLDHVEWLVTPVLAELDEPLALRLDIGVGTAVDLLHQGDLDNYLYPVVKRLGTRRFHSVWATKTASTSSFIRVEAAKPSVGSRDALVRCGVVTQASATTLAFKQEVHRQVLGATPLPAGPVWLEVAFTVSPPRNWANLWKPTIDALDPILGHTYAEREWHPQDGRIVDLGLHCTIDSGLGHGVRIGLQGGPIHPS